MLYVGLVFFINISLTLSTVRSDTLCRKRLSLSKEGACRKRKVDCTDTVYFSRNFKRNVDEISVQISIKSGGAFLLAGLEGEESSFTESRFL